MKPIPGSPEAKEDGCTCDPPFGAVEGFWVKSSCPVHCPDGCAIADRLSEIFGEKFVTIHHVERLENV